MVCEARSKPVHLKPLSCCRITPAGVDVKHDAGIYICSIKGVVPLLNCCRSLGAGATLELFCGSSLLLRRRDGARVRANIPPQPAMLHELVRQGQWDKAVRLARLVQLLAATVAAYLAKNKASHAWRRSAQVNAGMHHAAGLYAPAVLLTA